MQTAFYLYTIFVILICIASGTLSLAAYLTGHRRSYLYSMAFFVFYSLDLVIILQYEFIDPAHSSFVDLYYIIDSPVLKTLLAVGALESLWLLVCDQFEEHRKALYLIPPAVYVAAAALVLNLMPEGPLRQWTYYGLRQVFLAWMIAFWLCRYARLKDPDVRQHLHRYRMLVLIATVLVVCILAEDTYVIFCHSPTPDTPSEVLLLYLSERNFSENLLTLAFAVFCIRAAANTLSLRFQEPPIADSGDRMLHMEDVLPAYAMHHDLTAREREVLVLVVQGKDNQNIASELHLAVGTVKTHVHNIMAKAGCSNRQELIRDFWSES